MARFAKADEGVELNKGSGETRIPRIGERVGINGHHGLFAVIRVYRDRETADLKLRGRSGTVLTLILNLL
jgi:hypothetical protein